MSPLPQSPTQSLARSPRSSSTARGDRQVPSARQWFERRTWNRAHLAARNIRRRRPARDRSSTCWAKTPQARLFENRLYRLQSNSNARCPRDRARRQAWGADARFATIRHSVILRRLSSALILNEASDSRLGTARRWQHQRRTADGGCDSEGCSHRYELFAAKPMMISAPAIAKAAPIRSVALGRCCSATHNQSRDAAM